MSKRIFPITIGLTLLLSACGPQPKILHQTLIKRDLTDPESAVFRGYFQSAIDQDVWCGEINSRNRMGGMVGFTRYVIHLPPADLNIDSVKEPDRAKLYSMTSFDMGDDWFISEWKKFCHSPQL